MLYLVKWLPEDAESFVFSSCFIISFSKLQSKFVTEEENSEAKETFLLFDNRGDGKIAASQIGDVLRALMQNPTEQEINKCGYYQNPGDCTLETISCVCIL